MSGISVASDECPPCTTKTVSATVSTESRTAWKTDGVVGLMSSDAVVLEVLWSVGNDVHAGLLGTVEVVGTSGVMEEM